MNIRHAVVIVLAAGALACGPRDETRRPESDTASDTGKADGMAGMMLAPAMIAPMRAHTESLATATGPALEAAIASHEARAGQLLDAMGADMRMMSMVPDEAWAALLDSVRVDLANLSAATGQSRTDLARAHAARLRRLMDMHERMM